jgi:hypothetical protein
VCQKEEGWESVEVVDKLLLAPFGSQQERRLFECWLV